MSINMTVLASGGGTTLQNLIDRIAAGTLDARIVRVIASRPGIKAIDRAKAAGIPADIVQRSAFPTLSAFSAAALMEKGTQLFLLAGWLSLLEIPPHLVGRVMNIHPALLPAFGGRGMFGHHVHAAVLAHGCKLSGCTVHFVDNQYDAGPIILQRACPVLDDDTPDTLAARVFKEECEAYPEAIRLFAAGRLRIEGRRVRVMSARVT